MSGAPEWRSVESFPDYEVSDDGQIRRAVSKGPSRAGRLLRGTVYGNRRRVKLRDPDGKPVLAMVHRLVAEAFKGPCPVGERTKESLFVCHDDGDGLNNAPDNLFYRTQKQNMADRERHGRTPRGETNGEAKLTERQVLEIRRRFAAGGLLVKNLADEFGVTGTQIGAIVYGKNWRHIGGPICIRPPRGGRAPRRRPVVAGEACA